MFTARMPSATATNDPGTMGAKRRRPRTTASETTPTVSVRHCVSPRWPRKSHSCSKKSPSPLGTPNSFGTWPIMIVSASPMMKPFSTGSEMKLAKKPSRNRPAASASTPVVSASAAVNAAKFSGPPVVRSATAAADRAAVAAMGPVTRCLELPNAAYKTSAGGAAYNPTTGETPAMVAYASASGTRTAQTVSPARRSPDSHFRR